MARRAGPEQIGPSGTVVPRLICTSRCRPLRPCAPYTGGVAAGAPRIAVVQFPGTNCERETLRELAAYGACPIDLIWHRDPFPVSEYTAVVLPGGFAHGDHLRAG